MPQLPAFLIVNSDSCSSCGSIPSYMGLSRSLCMGRGSLWTNYYVDDGTPHMLSFGT